MADSPPATLGVAAAPAVLARAANRVRPHARLLVLLSLGHLVIDANQGALAALLPSLRGAHGLSYAQAGTIVLMGTLASSVIQPAFGWLADRSARRWLLPLAVVLSGLGVGLLGVATGYASLLALVLVMGLGVAAYHPEGYKTATGVAGDRKATGLAWFALGGNVGIALGPPLITTLVAGLGLAGSLAMLVPSLAAAAMLLAVRPRLDRAEAPAVSTARLARGADMPRAMALLILVVTLRSWTTLGFTTFVPFYYVDHLKADPRVVGTLLFVFLGAGALGTVAAGPLADRWGPRRFMTWVFLAALPFGILFLETRGLLALVMLALFGAMLTSSFSVSVVLGQAYLPRHAGMASGLIVGFAIGTGGLAVTLLGWIADHHGLPLALWISALLPAAGFAAARWLPAPGAVS